MPLIGLSLSLPVVNPLQQQVALEFLPLSSNSVTLNFSSAVQGYWQGFSAGNYSLARVNNNNWKTSGADQTSQGFYYGLAMAHHASWPGTFAGFFSADNKWFIYNGYVDDGSPGMDILYYHPSHPHTSIPISGWLLGSSFGTPTTGGTLTIS